jgi:hypothetical protein
LINPCCAFIGRGAGNQFLLMVNETMYKIVTT